MGVVPVFKAVKDGILPLPLPARPMAVLVFVHVNVAPVVGLEKVVPVILFPLQTVIPDGTLTTGKGFTVMVYVETTPGQLLAEGVTVTVAVTGLKPVLEAVKAGILPVPPAASPMEVFELVHEKTVPGVGLEKLVMAIVAP